MREIDYPTFEVKDSLADCIQVRRDKDLKSRLLCVSSEICATEKLYVNKGVSSSFYELMPTDGVGTCVSTSEMGDLYSEVFARKSSLVRKKFYDELLLAPVNGICPFCGQRDVSTLDHYLPKSKHPKLTVTPINLVAACKDCNHTKGEHQPVSATDQFLHPYFDRIPQGIWLVADVEKSRPPALIFRISTPAGFDDVMKQRLAWQFKKLNLAKLYASHAGSMLSGIADKLLSAWNRGGRDEVRFILSDDAKSWSKYSPNCWQATMYRALVNSDWFCNLGYAYAGETRKRV